MLSILAYFLACAFLSVCNSAFVDTLMKCSYEDDKCVAGMVENILKDISKTGVQELNIPPIDPMDLSNISIPILGLLNITLEEGQLKGIKECVVDSIHNDIANGVSNMDLTCDLIIKAKFKLDEISPIVQNLLGQDSIRANGNCKIKLDKLRMKMQFYYHFIKKEDGDVYFKCHLDEFRHNFEIGDLKMSANKIFFGNQDISEFVVSFFNQNWKIIIPSFGQGIFDVAMNIFKIILHRFFEVVSVKYFLADDLTSFVKN